MLAGCRPTPQTPSLPANSSDPATAPVTPPHRLFVLPTPNQALLQPGGEDAYFVGTVGRTWESGTFGCVRTEGRQFHEGLDIRPVERDSKGEAADPVLAAADGSVAYVNTNPGLSN